MSQENVAVVQRAFVAWNKGDFDALAADSAPDVVWNLSRVDDWPEQDTYSGLLELRAFWDLWLGTWGDHHLELLALVAKTTRCSAPTGRRRPARRAKLRSRWRTAKSPRFATAR